MNKLPFYQSSIEFHTQAINCYEEQFTHNPIYRSFCDLTHRHPSDCESLVQIPFLPISFLKHTRFLQELRTAPMFLKAVVREGRQVHIT